MEARRKIEEEQRKRQEEEDKKTAVALQVRNNLFLNIFLLCRRKHSFRLGEIIYRST